MRAKRIEFFVTPQGEVMYQDGDSEVKLYKESDIDLTRYVLEMIEHQYPEAFVALSQVYAASKLNRLHFNYLRVSRFVRCNFGEFDGLTYDVECGVLHIEEVSCPMKCECPMYGVICKPKPFGLTERETEVASMIYSGMSYEEASCSLNISPSTIKNTLQKIKAKLGLKSSKDVSKLFVAIL